MSVGVGWGGGFIFMDKSCKLETQLRYKNKDLRQERNKP